jgi:biopolymer transport protein ExbB
VLALIEAAGWPIWFLIACSVVALALMVERALSLRRSRVAPKGLLEELLARRERQPLSYDLLDRLAAGSALGRILATGIRHESGGPAAMRQAMQEAGQTVAHELGRYLTALGTVASIAPLLGLFGTVIGMIEIFAASSPGSASANPQQLAQGISIALYNTAFGILIAVPAMIAYRHFRARVDGLLVLMEQQASSLVNYCVVAAERS